MAAEREELEKYFSDFSDLIHQLDTVTDNLLSEYLERKLEYFIVALFGLVCFCQNGENDQPPSDVVVMLKNLYEFAYRRWEEVSERITLNQSMLQSERITLNQSMSLFSSS